MDHRVIAVIVTFNRKETLRECLAAVSAQTHPLTEIVVVNNASSDGTNDMLETEYVDVVSRIHMGANVGGAGGFYRGMEWAYASGAEWLWLMDDDGIPEPDCLERLLEQASSDGLDVVNPLVVSMIAPDQLAFGHFTGSGSIESVHALKLFARGEVLHGSISPFNGTLISRSAVEKTGPIKREMFIWGDEIEYGIRLKTMGIPHATVLNAVHRHPPQRKTVIHSRFLGVFYLPHQERAGIYHRNFAFNSMKTKGLLYLTKKMVAYLIFFALNGHWRRMKDFILYSIDGLTDRYAMTPSRTHLFFQGEHFSENRTALRQTGSSRASPGS